MDKQGASRERPYARGSVVDRQWRRRAGDGGKFGPSCRDHLTLDREWVDGCSYPFFEHKCCVSKLVAIRRAVQLRSDLRKVKGMCDEPAHAMRPNDYPSGRSTAVPRDRSAPETKPACGAFAPPATPAKAGISRTRRGSDSEEHVWTTPLRAHNLP